MPALTAGEVAPDFDLQACTGEQRHRFRLSALQGEKNVVLAFYVLDWTPT
jgi:peroxiredoxin